MTNKPIRVLQYIGCLEMGGSQSMIMNIYRNIDRSKIQFDFIVDVNTQSPYIQEIKALGGKIYTFKHHFNGINYFKYIKQWDIFFMQHKEYQILHSHVRSVASIVFRIAKKHNLITIAHSHSTSNGKGIKAAVKHILQKRITKNCDFFLACSQESANWLYGEKIAKSDKCKIIHNGIDINLYQNDEKKRKDIRRKLKIESKTVLGQVGRIEKVKNYEFSLNILAELNKKERKYHLLIIGSGSDKNKIIQLSNQLKINDCITILERRTDVPDLLKAMDIYIMPSLYEGLPVSLIEAQAASLFCVISSRINSGILSTDTVKKLPIDNPKIWADYINSNVNTHKQINGTKLIKDSKFNINQSVEELSNVYLKIIDKKKKKIMFCLGSMGNGGAERVVTNLCNNFTDKSEIIIVTNKKQKPVYSVDKKVKYLALDENNVSNNRIIRTIQRVGKLRSILNNEKPTMAIAFLPEPSVRLLIAKTITKIPTIISERNDPNKEYGGAIKRFLINIIYQRADGIVFQTSDAQKWFTKKIQKKSTIIPNPIDEKYICPPYKGKRNKKIVTVGRLTEQKNQKLLIDAFSLFNNKYPDYKLEIYGDGLLRNKLQDYITSSGLEHNILLKGKTDDIKNSIYKAAAFVLTSSYEGMPNALMEAMAMGVPCVSTDCPIGGPKFLISSDTNGILTSHNAEEISNAIKKIVENESFSKKISLKAHDRCRQFSTSSISRLWLNFMDEIEDRKMMR